MALRLRAVAATLLLVVGVIAVYNGMWARDVVQPTVSLAPEAVPLLPHVSSIPTEGSSSPAAAAAPMHVPVAQPTNHALEWPPRSDGHGASGGALGVPVRPSAPLAPREVQPPLALGSPISITGGSSPAAAAAPAHEPPDHHANHDGGHATSDGAAELNDRRPRAPTEGVPSENGVGSALRGHRNSPARPCDTLVPTYIFVASPRGCGRRAWRSVIQGVTDVVAPFHTHRHQFLDDMAPLHFQGRDRLPTVDEVASAFEHGIPALEGMAARRERCAKDGFTGDTPVILVDALSEFPLTTEDHGLERPDLHRLHALAARGAVRLRVLFWYMDADECVATAEATAGLFSAERTHESALADAVRVTEDQLMMLSAAFEVLPEREKLLVRRQDLLPGPDRHAEALTRVVRFMYGDSLDAQSDIGGVDGAVQAALARTEVADGLASLSASAARKGPSQSQVASFFAERAHLWPSLSLVEPPLAQVQRGNGDPNRQVYIVVVAVEGAGHHLIGEWVRHQRLSLVKSKFYDCHRSAATRLSWPRVKQCFERRTRELRHKYASKIASQAPRQSHFIEHQCSFPFDNPRNALRRPDVHRLLKLHGSTFDLRLVLLYRNVVSSVLSKAADGSHATHARGASLQSRIVESNLVAINASTWWLPDWMVLRLRYEDVLARPAVAQQRLSQFLQMQEPGEEEFGLKSLTDMMTGHKPTHKKKNFEPEALETISDYFLSTPPTRSMTFRHLWHGLPHPAGHSEV